MNHIKNATNALIRAKVFLYLLSGFCFNFNLTSMFLYAISKNTEHLLLSFVEQLVFGITLFSKD